MQYTGNLNTKLMLSSINIINYYEYYKIKSFKVSLIDYHV